MKVLVYGGRNYSDRRRLYAVLDDLGEREKITTVIEGEASGADRMARQWANDRGLEVLPFPAAWDDIDRPGAVIKKNRAGKLYDAAAGSIRNEKMLRFGHPDLAVGFPGGTGTKDMTKRCWEYGLRPLIVGTD